MKRMLLVYAHPDDETFTSAGTIAKYIKNGWEVYLLCATRGQAGQCGPYGDIDGSALGIIRERELREVGRFLGVKRVTFLDYKDGRLPDVPVGDLEDIFFKSLREIAPSVVITFEPGGISNHPDHIKITRSITFAFQKYVEAMLEVQEKGISIEKPPRHPRDAWQIPFAETTASISLPKLYYVCLPQSVGEHLIAKKLYPKEIFGKPWSLTPDKHITTVIDIKEFSKKKELALQIHRTQEADVARFLSDPAHTLLKHEFFILRMQGKHEIFMGKNDRVSDRL